MSDYNPRSKEIYVSPKTKRRLRWICENLNGGDTPHGMLEKHVTQDALAEQLLNNAIEEKYPNIVKLEKRFLALEDQLICELSQNLKEEDWNNAT